MTFEIAAEQVLQTAAVYFSHLVVGETMTQVIFG